MQKLRQNYTLQGGKYKIERVLGQGGFGITYLAIQSGLERKVAIKEFFMKELCERDESTSRVSAGSAGSLEMVERFKNKFLKEARLITAMNHNHIVRIYDIFEENGTAYYVMEHLDGGSLAELVDGRALSEEVSLRYTHELADALHYIHQQNVLHLDVKPANVLFRSNGEVVLIDFGISKRYDDEGGQTSTTPMGISKGYAPMEQYNQGLTNFSPATDIYSLGATLYKMLTGKTPPEASLLLDDDGELVRPAHVSFSTWVAVEKAMEPRRKRRPQSVSEFLSLLGDGAKAPVAPIVATPIVPAAIKDVNEETRVMKETEAMKITQQNDVLRFVVNGVYFEMIRVEAGTFTMGATSEIKDPWDDERPAHQVTLKRNYYIGKTQVTQALWQAVMGSNPSTFKGDNLPVESVSWDDCQEFVSKLKSLTGQKFRLPTEAEWEFAARGGNKSNHYLFSGSNNLIDVAWYGNNSRGEAHDVATKQPNELGIYDMSGNVWEWCADLYGSYGSNAQINPTGSNSGACHVGRGGSWFSDARCCRSSFRCHYGLGSRYDSLGFRLALSE